MQWPGESLGVLLQGRHRSPAVAFGCPSKAVLVRLRIHGSTLRAEVLPWDHTGVIWALAWAST